MHSTACGVGASATNLASLQTTCNSNSATATADAHKMVHHSNDDAMNKIPLKSASGLDDEEKNGGELMQDTAAAEEARREQMHANLLAWSKKLTIGVICFIGIALIGYVIISLVFSDWPKSTPLPRNITKELPTPPIAASASLFLPLSTNTSTGATNTTASTRIRRSSATAKENRTKSAKVEPKHRQNVKDYRESTSTSFKHAAVCSDRQICSDVGSDVLAKNGSAVDATIATMLCNGLTSVETMGFGGGFTMNIYDRKSQQGYYVKAQPILIGNHSDKVFAMPGEVFGYHKAHQRFGKLPWRELFEASLKICNTGFTMSKLQETFVHRNWHLVKDSPQYQSVFINPTTGKLHETGSLLKPPQQLCNTYKLLAENGASDFYSGAIAQMLFEDLKEMGSVINPDDLNSYDAHLGHSNRMPLGEDTLLVAKNENSGDLVAKILSILEEYNFTRDEETFARSMERIIEATKKISDVKKSKFKAPNRSAQFTIVAPNGDAVAATSFINSDFGSGLMGTRTGLSLNNLAGKRCHSTQAPMLLLDAAGNIRMSIAAGGIIDTVEVMARLLWLEKDIQAAVNQPDLSIDFDNEIVRHEYNKFTVVVAKLLAIDQSNVVSCATQRVARDLHVASKGGGVAGF
ncbi:glutathione hydrolase 1 proenzyme isoform X4 [Drosophila sulfurigaster albostrigata]|uniref:glutathione hydrolase 1 proenzyme isoform X4 n=1 Tax=Drosophila sulfurigaster albostrigata TaxID=89887 RepID=UPI002D21A0B8|nr:glutathione hydrolase 1 proenzyme isoform X4 [Drosophila sulfurigaster albostrigata]